MRSPAQIFVTAKFTTPYCLGAGGSMPGNLEMLQNESETYCSGANLVLQLSEVEIELSRMVVSE